MRAGEFIQEDVAAAGDVAPVSMPIGTIQRRAPLDSFSAKYSNRKKKRKQHARRRS